MPLTKLQCDNAKPKDKPYKLTDGNGMYLEIMPNGSKYWRLKYRFAGKERRLALGVYGPPPLVGLAEARDKRTEAKKLLANNIDPAAEKKQARIRAVTEAENTFKTVALEWLEIAQSRWSEGYTQKLLRRMEMHLFPFIGARPIAQITPPELLDCLRKVEKTGALDMAGRAKQVAGQIFRYGIQTGRCERDPAADLKDALRTHRTEHFRTIESTEIGAFLGALNRNEARIYERTRRAVWLSMLTFCRPGEIRQARWSHIDLTKALWSIPAKDMKARRDHIVPLSKQAVAILKQQQEETGHIATDYVFPSQIEPRNCMSDGTVNRAIARLGYGEQMVAHGVRALARTTLRETLGYESEVIERQLAHASKEVLGDTYDRTKFLKQRTEMMQCWADYLEALATETTTHFEKAA